MFSVHERHRNRSSGLRIDSFDADLVKSVMTGSLGMVGSLHLRRILAE